MRNYLDRVRAYQCDHFMTPVSWGRVRRFLCHWVPSFWLAAGDMLTDRLNASLFDMSDPRPRKLHLWERVLLKMGF